MSDNHDFITVDKDRMTKCVWCGTLESENWIQAGTRARLTGFYCSMDCSLAGGVELQRRSCWIMGIMGLFVFLLSLVTGDVFIKLVSAVPVLLLLYLGVAYYRGSMKGLELRKQLPKGSRSDDTSLDLVVLKSARISASCHKCGANLNLAEIGPERIYKCRYCGAEGIIEWPLDDEDMPEEE